MTARCTRSARGQKYVPLDELLAMPRVRVLRFMRRADWVASTDIYVALNVADHEVGNYNQIVCRLVKERLLDRFGHGINHYTYRLSDKGRGYLSLLLSRAELLPPISERELFAEDAPW